MVEKKKSISARESLLRSIAMVSSMAIGIYILHAFLALVYYTLFYVDGLSATNNSNIGTEQNKYLFYVDGLSATNNPFLPNTLGPQNFPWVRLLTLSCGLWFGWRYVGMPIRGDAYHNTVFYLLGVTLGVVTAVLLFSLLSTVHRNRVSYFSCYFTWRSNFCSLGLQVGCFYKR